MATARREREMFRWVLHLTGELQVYHVAAAVRHKVFSFGGFSMNHGEPIHVRVFDTVSLRWAPPPPPPPVVTTSGKGGGGGERRPSDEVPSMRYGHTVVPIDEVLYMWGGSFRTGAYCNATYAFHADHAPTHRWSRPRTSGTVPEGRDDHSACILGKVMFIYGGWTQLTGYTNDLYRLDTAAMVWSLVNARGAPPRAACHSAAVVGTEMFVFGSRGEDREASGVGVFDTRSDSWLSGELSSAARPLPGGRGRSSAIFSHNGELYVHGGSDVLWKFRREDRSWTAVEPKGAGLSSRVPGMCCCVVGGRVVFSGGLYTRDLYVLDLSPSLKTLCKLAVIQRGLERLELPRDVRWELAAMTTTEN